MSYLLLLLLFAPLVGGMALAFWRGNDVRELRVIALGATGTSLAAAVLVVIGFDGSRVDAQMVTRWPWLASVGIHFHVGIDGISLWLVTLTALLSVTAVLVSWTAIRERPREYYLLLLLLETGMLGVFASLDIVLFYIFFEFTLIPLFFLIGIWGGSERRLAARKFFIYTLAGSVLTLLGLIYVVVAYYRQTQGVLTFSIPELTENLRLTRSQQWWLFLSLTAGFAIKVPLFPFHTWLPLAHVEAPTAGSVILAGVLLKIGTYGFVRFNLSLAPIASHDFLPFVASLSVAGIIYGALTALAQTDIKKLVAYSSVSHLGFSVLGLFALKSVASGTIGISGSILQMVNHGLSTGALFALVGMLYERYHTREIRSLGGLAKKLPVLAFFFVFVTLSSIGLPGLNGFVGEILVLVAMFEVKRSYAVFAALGIILGAYYMLWLVQRVFFGPVKEPRHGDQPVEDASHIEIAALAPLCGVCLWIGVYPSFFLSRMEPTVSRLAQRLESAQVGLTSGGGEGNMAPVVTTLELGPRSGSGKRGGFVDGPIDSAGEVAKEAGSSLRGRVMNPLVQGAEGELGESEDSREEPEARAGRGRG